MSHPDRRAFLRALTLLPFSAAAVDLSARGQRLDFFQRGWNHPWIAYGHDFGAAWGHDGLSTSGWTCDTGPSARGFTNSEVTLDPDSGHGALRIDVRLLGGDPSRSRGAVHVSLADHWPFSCPPPGGPAPLNLDGVLARYRIRLPRGSAGSAAAPHVLQLFLKTRLSASQWPSLYTAPVTINPSWEERSVEIVVRLDSHNAAHVDPGFDIRSVSLIGLSMATGAGVTTGEVQGTIWLDEVVLETADRIVFDFERPAINAQFGHVRGRAGRGLTLARFFVLCDGRAAPTFAPDGSVVGLDELFFRDFDVLVRAAEEQRVWLIPVLLDFGWCAHPSIVSGVQLGGHADVIRDAAKRQQFFDRVLRPLLERYGRHPSIFAWDVCNEPEWVIDETPDAFRQTHDVVSRSEMRAFVQGCAAYVHGLSSTHLVTVGSARRKWLRFWTGCGLDFYQFHWYDHFAPEEPFPWRPYDELGLDRPCLIGEVPTRNTGITPQEFLVAAAAGGYSGLLFWSYGARDTASDLCGVLDEEPARPRPRDSRRAAAAPRSRPSSGAVTSDVAP